MESTTWLTAFLQSIEARRLGGAVYRPPCRSLLRTFGHNIVRECSYCCYRTRHPASQTLSSKYRWIRPVPAFYEALNRSY